MKKLYFFLLLTVLISGCEKDDFCIDPITPNLIVRFYDNDDMTSTLSVTDLYVWPEGRDSIIIGQNTDSITIPLDVNNGETIYNFSMGDLQEQVTIDYTVNEVFVSRSCGFKAIFESVGATQESNNWIQNIEVISTIIEDESAAHIQIFH